MLVSDLCYVDDTGFHYADFPTVLEFVQNEYRAIYGADVYLEPDSQDGQWLAIQAQMIYDCFLIGAQTYNSFSPSTAQGIALARNVKINGIKKKSPGVSEVDVVVVGTVGTSIDHGIAEDTVSQKWLLPDTVVIPISGTITVTATAEKEGAVLAAANSVNKIYTPTLGWQTVNNPAMATPGAAVETDAELRLRQTQSVALPALTVLESTIGAVEAIPDVLRVVGYENDDDVPDANGESPHSIAIVAEGGDVQAIANAIAAKKTPGTRTDGTTDAITYDKYGMPNTIRFYRPTTVAIKAEIHLTAYTGYSSSYADLIKAALATYINALKIGDDVLYTKLFVPINLPGTPQGATFDIVSLEIAKVSDSLATDNIVIAYIEAAAMDVSNIVVVVDP